MIVQAEVVDRDEDCHLLRTDELGLVQATFEGMGFRVGSLLTVDLKPTGEMELIP